MNIELVKRHLGQPLEVEIGGDIVKLAMLPAEVLPEFYSVISRLKRESKGNIDNFNFDKETSEYLGKLVRLSCEGVDIGKPSNDEEQKVFDAFVSTNFIPLMLAVLQGNTQLADTKDNKRVQKMLNRNGRTAGDNSTK